MARKSLILTKKEVAVMNKRLSNQKLTQQDSNYLSRFVRPKLREMSQIDARALLERLRYKQKTRAIEKRIKHLILRNLRHVASITIYGSAVHTNYTKYNDIDVLVIVRKKTWKTLAAKYKKILELKKSAEQHSLNLDLEILDQATFQKSYPSNVTLVYQLKDSKTIYGDLQLPRKPEIPKLLLRMKIDHSIPDNDPLSGLEIYKALRNLMLVRLVLRRIIDNTTLINSIDAEIGSSLAQKLKSNRASQMEKNIALLHLNRLIQETLNKLEKAKWESVVLLSH